MLASFWHSLWGAFLNWDDNYYILDNSAVTGGLSLAHLKLIFSQYIQGIYSPLATLSFALEYQFFGPHPFMFHLDNLLGHGVVVALVYFLAVRLKLSTNAGLAAALIFAIHPMRVESVAWIAERKDVLYAVFYLLAIHQYLDYTDTKRWGAYGFSLLFGFSSVLVKPMAVSLPLILLLLDWFKGRPLRRQAFIEKIPFMVYMAAVGCISFIPNARNPVHDIGQAFLIWAWSLSFYVWQFFWPVHLSPVYGLPQPVSLAHWPYAGAVLTLGMLMGLILKCRDRLVVFAIYYYFFSIFFLLRYDFGVDKIIVADHLMYLPSLGICFLLADKFCRWAENCGDKNKFLKWRACALGVALVLLLCGKTFFQCQIWKDPLTLWNEVIQQNSNSFFAYNNRGNIYNAQGLYDLAIADYTKALALNPRYAIGYNNRGVLYAALKDEDKALDDFNRVISLGPGFSEGYMNRSIILARRKNYAMALADAHKAQAAGGSLPDGYLIWLQQQLHQ